MVCNLLKTITFLLSLNAFGDSITIGLLGITSHQKVVSTRGWEKMKHKISKTNYVVWNPQINLTYEHSGWLLNATAVQDCYGFGAYYAGAGRSFRLMDTLSLNALVGVYHRKQYIYYDSGDTKRQTLFMPWIGVQKDFPITERISAFVSLNTNYFLTHALTGIKQTF